MSKLKIVFLVLEYVIVCILAVSFFYISRPYTIIDHNKSNIICTNSNKTYELGPNFFYLFGNTFDPLIDSNIRKLCEYEIINDYQNTFKTPDNVNYKISPVYIQEMQWGDTFLVAIVFIMLGIGMAELIQKQIMDPVSKKKRYFFAAFVVSLVIVFLFLKPHIDNLYCERQVASSIANFKKSAYGFGLSRFEKDEAEIKKALNIARVQCLEKVKKNNLFESKF